VRGDATAKDVLATVMAMAKKIKKTAVVSGVCDGFIGNRMVEQYARQGGFLLDEGCTPEQVDKAIEKFGFAMGPFRMGDLAGNDIGWAIRKRRLVFSLVNEAAHILEEGIANKASDIDVVYIFGYGFPVHRGGPLKYADEVGLFNVAQAMKRFAQNPLDDGAFWQPAPLLARLAAEGKTFN
jgi:3-hydroxyacyl-CoA dehydrogenase